MEISQLIDLLTDPQSYPNWVESVEVKQTHISAVFLAGDFVYKVKKPVVLGFLDFTTLEKRRHFCEEEVRLNRRLAPDVYLDAVPIVQNDAGVRLEGTGEPIEWAVKMRRLPDEATLLAKIQNDSIDAIVIETFARRLAEFHRLANTNQRIAQFGKFEMLSQSILNVFDRSAPLAGLAINQQIFERIKTLATEQLELLHSLIDQRASDGKTRDCHGDLHLDHVYWFPDQATPNDLVIIDCIEFNEPFRFIDPIADMAFAAMDLAFYGRRDLTTRFIETYFSASNDTSGRKLLPLYTAYRAAVRGMVDGFLLQEKEVPAEAKSSALIRANAHWLLALTELEQPRLRPGLLFVGGLPGTGKSFLARLLAEHAGFQIIRSDVVRKELAGLPINQPTPDGQRESLYSHASTDRTYAECLNRAERLLHEGQRVIVDATFRENRWRQEFTGLGIRSGTRTAFLICEATADTVKERLAHRHGDASDADWIIYQRALSQWETSPNRVQRLQHVVSTEGTPEDSLHRGLAVLSDIGLWE